jgi:HK97 family phage major capsid protein
MSTEAITLKQVVNEFRKTTEHFEEFGGSIQEHQNKIEKILTDIDSLEKKNQELVLKQAQERKEFEEMKENFVSEEKKRLLLGNAYDIDKKTKSNAEKQFDAIFKARDIGEAEQEKSRYLSILDKEMSQTEWGTKFMRTDVNTDGGILVVPEVHNEIIKKITEYSDIRKISKVRPTIGANLQVKTRTVLISGGFKGESISSDTDNSKYGQETITANRLTITATVTRQILMNSYWDMQTEVMNDVSERFAQSEGLAFVSGNGVEQPFGFMQESRIATVNSGIADSINMDSIIYATGQIKKGYNPMFVFNRRTRAFLMTLKSSIGQYLWTAGDVKAGEPNQIAGRAYLEAIDMDDIAANTYPIAYGDFSKGYMIVDRMAMTMIRDDYTAAKLGEVNFIFDRFVGGGVILPEAILKIKCST